MTQLLIIRRRTELSKLNPLIDVDFLKRLDTEKEREVFAKVISLDWDENPLEEKSVGRPEKSDDEKSEKTIQNLESMS